MQILDSGFRSSSFHDSGYIIGQVVVGNPGQALGLIVQRLKLAIRL